MRKLYLSAVVVTMLGLHSGTAAAAYDNNTVLAGDIATGLLPVAALSVVYFKDDGEGWRQWLRSTVVNEIVNTGLRGAFNGTSWGKRPNGGSYGFPSGHAGFVFSQAAFLQDRYGWEYGVPAFAVATAVSYIRVHEDKHHWRDVIAGAVLSIGISKLFVTPEDATHLAPIIGPDFFGMRWERSF